MKIKNLTALALVLLALVAITTPKKVYAQDEEATMDSPAIIPSTNQGQSMPPAIIDESDSGGVSEVEEYDN